MRTKRLAPLVVASTAVALYSCTYDYSKLRYSTGTDSGGEDAPAQAFEAGAKGEGGTGGTLASGGTIGDGGGSATGGSTDGGGVFAGTGGAMATGGSVGVDGGPDLSRDVPLGETDLGGPDLAGAGGLATTGGSSGGGAAGTGGVIGTGGATGSDGPSTDGATNTGGAGTGGLSGTGGVATGGGTGSGGIPGSGGSAIDAGGAVNHAVELAGNQFSYVDVGNVPIPADFTLEVWTKVAATQSAGTDHMMIVKDTSFVSENQFRIYLWNGYLMFMMTDPTGQDGGLFTGTTSSLRTAEPVATEVWLHFAITKAGTTFVLYLNGSPQTTATTTVNLSHAGNVTMRFGGRNSVDDTWFHGAVDEVRLWNVARSATDIQADMAHPIASSRADFTSLVAYWKLDEGAGAVTADARGTFYGVLSSSSWLTPGAPLQY